MTKDEYYEKSIEELKRHAAKANEEVGDIKIDIAEIKGRISHIEEHVGWVKDIYEEWNKRVDKIDERTWYILTTIILGFLVEIAIKLYLK